MSKPESKFEAKELNLVQPLGQKDAEAKLTQKVPNGGGGVWGAVAMPANKGQVTEAEAKELVKWVLSLK